MICLRTTYTFFLPSGGWYGAYFHPTGIGFQDTGWFLKLPYLGMEHWQNFQKLHMYTFILLQGMEIELIFVLRAAVSEVRADFQKCHMGVKWNLVADKRSQSCIYILSFYPGGSKLSLFLLYGQRFPRYEAISKLPYLGTKLSQIGVSEIWADFQNCHFGAWDLVTDKKSTSCTCTLFVPKGVEIELIFALQAPVSKIRADFQNCHIWARNLAIRQSSRNCTHTL